MIFLFGGIFEIWSYLVLRISQQKIEFSRESFLLWQVQHAKKVMSDSPGLVYFAIGLVIFVLNLPDGQVLFFGEIQITEGW